MSKLAVRIAEDSSRPLGFAIVTVEGMPKTLETFEFVLRRHGYADNNLGPEGWQGPEAWLTPEEAWFSGQSFRFVVGPQVVYQMESMPYDLVLRGQGMEGVVKVTFVWPLELEVEQTVGEDRQAVGGTRVHPVPRGADQSASRDQTVVAAVAVPKLETADITIPKLEIPAYELAPAAKPEPLPNAAAGLEQPPPLPPLAPEPEAVPQEPAQRQAPPLPPQSESSAMRSPPPPPQAAQVLEPFSVPAEPPMAKPKATGVVIGSLVLAGLVAFGIAVWLIFSKDAAKLSVPNSPGLPQASQSAPEASPPQAKPVPVWPTSESVPSAVQLPKPLPADKSAPATEPASVPESGPPAVPAPAQTPESMATRARPPAPLLEPSSPPTVDSAPRSEPLLPAAPISPPTPVTRAAKPILKPDTGSPNKRDLESELKSQFSSDVESELESALKRKAVPQPAPERN